ncbi:MAG: ROK family protein [Eggerthellaceae bacterium]|nr:ROK family protein [Eggerthellaceae bacterium]
MGQVNVRPQAALALDVGGTKLAAAVVVVGGDGPQVRCRVQVPTETDRGAAHVMERMERAAARALADYRATESAVPVEACGAAALGCPDASGERVAFGANLMEGWTGMPVAARLSRAVSVPCVLLGDVQAHALGEARWGAAAGAPSCLCVAPGTGLGGGLVIDGRLVRGAHGLAGHLGHMQSVHAQGMRCSCGTLGHIEAVTSGVGIGALYQGVDVASADFDPAIDGAWVARRAAQGDARARAVLARSGFALGSEIGSWANLVDPAVIVIGGSVRKAGAVWREALERGFCSQALEPLLDVPLVDAALGDDAALVGAAEYALDRFVRPA